MTDTVSKKRRSEIMSAVRSKDTKLEIALRKILWKEGYRYRKNPLNYFGKPDIVLKSRKIVIFVDSCFWHGCKKHFRMPSTRRNYWKDKIERNIKRDKSVSRYYDNKKWKVIRVWEHDIKKNIENVVKEIEKEINQANVQIL